MKTLFVSLSFLFLFISAQAQPVPVSALFEQAYKFKKAKNYNEAIVTYSLILNLDKNSADAYLNRGLCYFELQKYDEAIKDLKKASELLPDNADVQEKLGSAYFQTGQYEDAIEHFTSAILKSPSMATAYNSRGMCYQLTGKFRQALSDYNMAIQLDPKMSAAYNNRGAATYYNQSIAKAARLDIESAIKDFTTALDINPLFCMAYKNRALAYSFLKKYKEAQEDAESAVNCSSNDPDNWETKGSIEIAGGQYNQAINDLKKSMQLRNADDPETQNLLSEAYMHSGDYGEAESIATELLENKLYKARAAYRLAQIEGYRQNVEMVVDNLKQANACGYFKDKDQLQSFLKDKAFEGMRKNEDFKKIVDKIKK